MGSNAASPLDAGVDAVSARVMQDRYRCPEGFFDFALGSKLSREAGFFKFGPNATGYGQSSRGVAKDRDSVLCDALHYVSVENAKVRLPFDPNDVIDNLRLERYAASPWSVRERVLKRIYYWLRPVTNRSMRKGIQRFRAGHWRKVPFPSWPVDTSVENICEGLMLLSLRAKGVDGVPFIWFWPKGARGCVLMTHDVETEVGRDHCPELLDINDSFAIKASFQIVPQDRYDVSPAFLDQIRTQGSEVCVQDLNHDGRLFDDREEFRRRASIINRYGKEFGARGFRSAVLYRRPEWFEDLEFSFDMSIPNVARLDPQRGGCCTVMPYFIGDILELPVTTVQDYTLFHLLRERSIDLWKRQCEMILAKYGLISFIVHPDYVIEPDTRAVYEALLSWLQELRAKQPLWFALPHEIDAWWRARQRMTVVKQGDSWRIEGEGAERATLAFARMVDGELVYEQANSPLSAGCSASKA